MSLIRAYSIETRRLAKEEKFDRIVRFPIVRFFVAVYFIAHGDSYLRPDKPDPTKPIFYRYGLWKVHNCGRRTDGTYFSLGGAEMIIVEEDGTTLRASHGDLPYSEMKAKWDALIIRLGSKRRSKYLPCKGRFSHQREGDVGLLSPDVVLPLAHLFILQVLHNGKSIKENKE